MKLAIMQPYFLPYLGYFQLIASADEFIVYDNIKYVKSGWINRNRLCRDGEAAVFSLPLKAASDSRDVRERELAPDFKRAKLLNQFRGAYRKAPQFPRIFPLLERLVGFEDNNLFRYLDHSIRGVCEHLGIGTPIRASSGIGIDHSLKSRDKVMALCRAAGADTYVNAIGGVDLYSKEEFLREGVELKFIRMKPLDYPQFGAPFVPALSIVDVLMFNPARERSPAGFGPLRVDLMFTWRKLGKVFTPQEVPGRPWLQEFAQAPCALVFDDHVRMYFSCRPKADAAGQYVSYSAYVDLDRGGLVEGAASRR